MKGLCVLGSTGSIGRSTLDVVSRYPDEYQIIALTANQHVEAMHQQCLQFVPQYAVMVEAQAAEQLRERLKGTVAESTEVLSGAESLRCVAALMQVDVVMAAIVGAAGLLSTLAAAEAGKRVLLANKESLVMSGALFMDAVREHEAELLPIDSEHNAIFQCMPSNYHAGKKAQGVRKILLTASGGPFWNHSREDLEHVTPDQACAHPKWSMGRKISVDSASLMNKGLEVIEASYLFSLQPACIQVVIHPQSIIHSLVDYVDGSVLAQLGQPDMRTPIAHALAWPKRMASGVNALDLIAQGELTFEKPDLEKFPCLRLAYEALAAGGTAPAILNAANEVAVASFLDEKIKFLDIPRVIEQCLEQESVQEADMLDAILSADQTTRVVAEHLVAELSL